MVDSYRIPALFWQTKTCYQVHVWAGISLRGRTDICSFTGIMARYLCTNILQQTLLLFIDAVHPDSLHFVTDNNLKHSSNYAKDFLWNNIVNWWRTPAELPDLNLRENVWHEVKEYMRWEVKSTTKEVLVQRILQFWESIDVAKCTKYIWHLQKVIP